MANKDNLEPQDWGSSENALDKWKVHAFPITKENKHFYLIVAYTLGLTTLISVIGIMVLGYLGREIPSALVAIGSVAVGALGSLFTQSK